uniref:G-type lectin S-receptor-like serine/threonine-protein kinase At4g03230 n=1 Tax=Fragaria vesca subsp. vesca TaxID=101020 RepID=UPI0005CAFD3C|nr:PREDICTED: G-type lectin S-receptor-like serine/threonine-protein kinase At4g03230 [Fragaria vesca subsp. vesca]
MPQVVFMLRSESATIPAPKQPAFVVRRCHSSSNRASNSSNKPITASNNGLTVTLEDGRLIKINRTINATDYITCGLNYPACLCGLFSSHDSLVLETWTISTDGSHGTVSFKDLVETKIVAANDIHIRVHGSELGKKGVSVKSLKRTLNSKTETGRIAITVSENIGGKNDTELPLFSLMSILAATNNFSEDNKLGEGGFGPVYKGILPGNQEVAVKRLSKKSGQGHHEFMNELKLIAKLQHTNLARLMGCCMEGDELILIYEYMPNRSLDKFLFDPFEKTKLDWGTRFRIIQGIAQGVLYIHKYSRLKIIHRDLKASNVLLDGTMNPKVSDFGMVRIFDINQIEANTNKVVGTYGYMSPEYALYGHFSEKLDVFSFGVLLLEIVSGKKNALFYSCENSQTLAQWIWQLWKEGRGMEVIDASVRETCRIHEALRCIHVGLLCVQEAPADRPTMSLVIHMLEAEEATSLPPSKEPAFSTSRNSNPVTIYSNNVVTITLPEPR